jgi:hypothetical protein
VVSLKSFELIFEHFLEFSGKTGNDDDYHLFAAWILINKRTGEVFSD